MKEPISLTQFQLYNPWWEVPEAILSDTFIEEYKKQKYRFVHQFYYDFSKYKNSILTLRGPRRVGKSTLVKLIIKHLLLEEKVRKDTVFFYSCDGIETFHELRSMLLEYLTYIRPKTEEHLYIFLDEISFVKEWQRAIKELADLGRFKNATLLLTGSNIIDLKFSSERLPGRRGEIAHPDIKILPLTFKEYVELIKPNLSSKNVKDLSFHIPELKKLFRDFLITGGFLNAINQYFEKNYIPTSVYETYLSWIEGDLHKVGKSESIAFRILENIFRTSTTPISYYRISKDAGLGSHSTVEDYIDVLTKMFVLFPVNAFLIGNKKVDYKKNRKIYFLDPLIANTLKARVSGFLDNAFDYTRKEIVKEDLMPALAEEVVASHLYRDFPFLYYGRFGEKEIDFVTKTKNVFRYFEVKYQRRLLEEEFKHLKEIIPKDEITILTRETVHHGKIEFIPVEVFLGRY